MDSVVVVIGEANVWPLLSSLFCRLLQVLGGRIAVHLDWSVCHSIDYWQQRLNGQNI